MLLSSPELNVHEYITSEKLNSGLLLVVGDHNLIVDICPVARAFFYDICPSPYIVTHTSCIKLSLMSSPQTH